MQNNVDSDTDAVDILNADDGGFLQLDVFLGMANSCIL
ncbi:MAG: hypothetical protein CM15mP42_09650 [Methanobacteriota archaeon]|nr:MAG: hypothetical protein CM15mP42_09650 [Euryarchaeota archaeon]